MNQYCGEPYNFTYTYFPSYPMKKIKRITRSIEKWGPEGEYLGKEVITEDLEDVEVPDYSQAPYQPNIQPGWGDFPTICDATQYVSGTESISLSGSAEAVSFAEGNGCSSVTQINPDWLISYTSKN